MTPKNAIKPEWPYPRTTKMFAAGNGQWAKKINGRRYHFGPWVDPKAALARYKAESPAIYEGTPAVIPSDRLTAYDLTSLFLSAKKAQMAADELSARMFDDYRRACAKMIGILGKRVTCAELGPAHFAVVREKLGPSKTRRANEITWLRTVFKWGYDSDLMDRPMKFGPDFKRPKARDIRKVKNTRGKKRLYDADDVRKLVAAAPLVLKVAILLAINAGMGNTDCGNLTMEELKLNDEMIDSVRSKTAFFRTAPLWPETVAAIKEWKAKRPDPRKGNEKLLLLTSTGKAMVDIRAKAHEEKGMRITKTDNIARGFNELCKTCGIAGKGFYDLRHTFRTVAESGAFNERTIDRVMGHVSEGMGTQYIHDFSISKLRAVTDHVRQWYLTP